MHATRRWLCKSEHWLPAAAGRPDHCWWPSSAQACEMGLQAVRCRWRQRGCEVSRCPPVLAAGSMPGVTLSDPGSPLPSWGHPSWGHSSWECLLMGPPLMGARGDCRQRSAASGMEAACGQQAGGPAMRQAPAQIAPLLQRTTPKPPPSVQRALLKTEPSLQLCCLALAAGATMEWGTPPCLQSQYARRCPGSPMDRPPRAGLLLSGAAHE